MKYKIEIISLSLLIISCSKHYKKEEKISMLLSNNIDSIIEGVKIIKKDKDTSMISYLLQNADDPRVNHRISLKGKSVYQIRMEAIKYLSGKAPDVEITYIPDSTVIKFYNELCNGKRSIGPSRK